MQEPEPRGRLYGSPRSRRCLVADRDIPEEMVEKAARAAFDAMKTGVFAAWSFDDLKVHRHHQERWRTAARDVLSAALAGRQVVDDWAAVETAVRRGIEQFARAYWIPANNLHGGDPDRRDRMAARWAEGSAEFVTACIREDLRKAEAGEG